MSATGTVKFFNITKGFGFILPANGGDDLFVHISDLAGNPLKEGDQVQYDETFDERKGKTRAVNVSGGTGWPLDQNQGGGGGGKGFGKSGFGGGYGGGFGGGYGGW